MASLALAANAYKPSLEKHFRANDVVMPPLADNSTYGNTEQIRTKHVDLDLTVDFDARTLSGNATHEMVVVAATSVAQFDIWDLTVNQVSVGTSMDDLSSASFTILQPNPAIGSVLQVTIPSGYSVGETVFVVINYVTSPTGQAFSWLNPE